MLGFIAHEHPNYRINWHHALIASKIDEMVFGDLRRLMIFVPPHHGKSELVSRYLPAFILGQNPDTRIIGVSYGSDLAEGMNTSCQRIMDTDSYRGLFPDTVIPSESEAIKNRLSYRRRSKEFHVIGRDGYYYSRGIGGSIFGKHYDWGIVDDPHKDAAEMNSPTARRKVLEYYDQVYLSRQSSDARIIILMTRWHTDDLAGELLRRAQASEKADQWETIRLPAIAEEPLHPDDPREIGEALWVDEFDEDYFERMEANVHEIVWISTYQQRPAKGRAGLFNPDNIEIVTVIPPLKKQCWFFDMANTKSINSDFTAGIHMGLTEDNRIIILNLYHERKISTETHDDILNLAEKTGAVVPIVIEGERGAIVQMPYMLKDDRSIGKQLSLQTPIGDKYTRATPFATRVGIKGQVLMLDNHLWNQKVTGELREFTGLGDTHDDIVDACSGAYEFLTGGKVEDKGKRVIEITL